jgi:hypothetical protein
MKTAQLFEFDGLRSCSNVLHQEFGREMDDIFEWFDPVPLGCASLAPVIAFPLLVTLTPSPVSRPHTAESNHCTAGSFVRQRRLRMTHRLNHARTAAHPRTLTPTS